MRKPWNAGDRLLLTRDCELGQKGEVMHVLHVDGAYMTVRLENSESPPLRTGRDYALAIRIGEAPVHDAERAAAVADVVRRLYETSERAPDVRAVPLRLVHQDLFDELLRLVGKKMP